MTGLREILEHDDEEEEAMLTPETMLSQEEDRQKSAILFQIYEKSHDTAYPVPTLAVRTILLELYRSRVDSVYKIFHWPTLSHTLLLHNQQEKYTEPSTAVQALQFSLFFMAVCSITDDEAVAMGLGERLKLRQLYRSAVEDLLARSSLLQNPDIITLQAFIVYLVRLYPTDPLSEWLLLMFRV